ncbi:hypothetical protein E7T06_15320 [Deinococcus sp. Arct2-2]|uniref:hypothetical protein n=1 Tax=Deinococcus sp. Arct2-2 TaxID=2568653 RepID=UPI0010A4EF5E|nr:hypothetical protein [Deinococcus sp. Arct2-2]THF68731.1 hypothetical protein E7T06_15320 [Deinococcus sp. Arct2-2]
MPFETIAAQLAGIRQACGAFVRLDTAQGQPLAVFERGTLARDLPGPATLARAVLQHERNPV